MAGDDSVPLWVSLVVAGIVFIGGVAAALVGGLVQARRDDKRWREEQVRDASRWQREVNRERERWKREDAYRWANEKREAVRRLPGDGARVARADRVGQRAARPGSAN